MTAYEALNPEVEVNGQTIRSVVEAFPPALQGRGEEILARNGIEDPEAGEWYPQQAWLDAFTELHERMGSATLARIGKEIPRNADWPPDAETIVDGVESIDKAYHMNHRGGEIGSYDVERIDPETIAVRCDTPYPCPFDLGIVKSVVDEFGDRPASVRETGSECREDGADECRYDVRIRR